MPGRKNFTDESCAATEQSGNVYIYDRKEELNYHEQDYFNR